MKKYFDSNDIIFNENNYIPFYFIYALLLGPSRCHFYKNKKILVVTNYSPDKERKIHSGLKKEGVGTVQFIKISRNRSFFDKINLSNLTKPIDLVLVGAGLGASNILCQLKEVNTLCIDAGYVIEVLANSALKKERTFCWPDEERDGDFSHV